MPDVPGHIPNQFETFYTMEPPSDINLLNEIYGNDIGEDRIEHDDLFGLTMEG